MKIIIALLIFSIIIIFHELGHFSLAKANGIRVNEFCLGLGPTILGVTKGETKYSLKLLPFGGACMMEGEDGESTDDRAFGKKSVWARISVVAAGPVFNFIMAFVFSFILLSCNGYDVPKITEVSEGFAAEQAGMQAGDVIVKMNGKHIHFYREVSSYSMFHAGETVEVTYERDGKRYTAELTYCGKLFEFGALMVLLCMMKNLADTAMVLSAVKWRKEMCLRIFCTVDMR